MHCLHQHGFNWGALWAALAAIGTLAAVGTALWFGLREGRRAARAQAEAVFSTALWDPSTGYRVRVNNGSGVPVFAVSLVGVDSLMVETGKVEWAGAGDENSIGYVSPPADSVALRLLHEGQPLTAPLHENDLQRLVTTIDFTDSRGVRWRRHGGDRPKRL